MVFCNPPYDAVGQWVRHAACQQCIAVMLTFARTDTRWFHQWVLPIADEIRFVRGRLKFDDGPANAPSPSMVIVYRERRGQPIIRALRRDAAQEVLDFSARVG